MRNKLLTIVLVFQTTFVSAQHSTSKDFNLLSYRSGMCFGTCPLIQCTIEKNKFIKVDRIIFKKYEDVDTLKSGSFIGKLTKQEWTQLENYLKSNSLTEINFPKKFCCDNPIVTIILKKKGKEQLFKSMFPQNEAMDLINFLNKIALNSRYKKISYNEELLEKLR